MITTSNLLNSLVPIQRIVQLGKSFLKQEEKKEFDLNKNFRTHTKRIKNIKILSRKKTSAGESQPSTIASLISKDYNDLRVKCQTPDLQSGGLLNKANSILNNKIRLHRKKTEENKSRNKELKERKTNIKILNKYKARLLEIAYRSLNRMRIQQNKPKFKFIIYTKGFLNLHKYNKLKITKCGSRLCKFSHKNKQPIILNDRNLTPIKSSNRNDNKDIKLLTLSHKSRNSKLKSNKISIMVSSLDAKSSPFLTDIYTSSHNRFNLQLQFKRSNHPRDCLLPPLGKH